MATFDTNPRELKEILGLIHNKHLALPDFQRDFIWDSAAIEDLIVSVAQNYPAGSLLFLRQGESPYFQVRAFEGAPLLNSSKPPFIVLDGQQRLTALYQAFYGAGEHLYYLHLPSLIDEADIEESVRHETRTKGIRKYGEREAQARELMLPLKVVYGEKDGFIGWLHEILDIRSEPGHDLRDQLTSVYMQWISNIEQYKFPVVTLPGDTGLEPVCKIFETLNRTGVRLGVFELLTARFYPVGVRLRDLWESARAAHPILDDYQIDPYYLLQVVALLSKAPSCKRSDVLGLKAEAIDQYWDKAVAGLAKGLQLLRTECGIFTPGWVPYYPMLLALAAIWSKVESLSGPAQAGARAKVVRWFWCSTFAQSYEHGANTRAQSDFDDLSRWIDGGEPPDSVAKMDFDAQVTLKEVTPRQRAVYRGVMAIMLKHGARDFHTGALLEPSAFVQRKISDHHVFPQAYLNANWPDTASTLRDSVLNRVLVDPETNSRIGARSPSQYLAEIASQSGSTQLDAVLDSHLLPPSHHPTLAKDDFEGFLEERQSRLASEIKSLTNP